MSIKKLTVKRIPEKDFASKETTADFINPSIIESHPRWAIGRSNVAWLNSLPGVWVLEVPNAE